MTNTTQPEALRLAAANSVSEELQRAHGVYLTTPSLLRIVDASLQASPPAPAAVAVPAPIAAGMKAAANLVQEQADLYIAEHAETDPDTGAVIWHHRDYGFDWHNGLEELAQKLLARAALPAAPAQEHATQLAGQAQQAVP